MRLLAIPPHHRTIRIFRDKNPALEPFQHPTAFHALRDKPFSPRLEISVGLDAPCDDIPTALRRSLRGIVPQFDEKVSGLVLEEHTEELARWMSVIELR